MGRGGGVHSARGGSKEKRAGRKGGGQEGGGDATKRWLRGKVGQGKGEGWGGGTKMEHRKAIKDGSVTRHWQRLRAQRRDARRLEERERERGQQSPTTTPFPSHSTRLPTTPNQYDHVKT